MRKKPEEVTPPERYLIACKLFLRTTDIQRIAQVGKRKAQEILLTLKKQETKQFDYIHSIYTVRTSLVLDYFHIDTRQLYLLAKEYMALTGGTYELPN